MSCSTCCCGSKLPTKSTRKDKQQVTVNKQQQSEQFSTVGDVNSAQKPKPKLPAAAKKSRSISWECLPFSSKKGKTGSKASKSSKTQGQLSNLPPQSQPVSAKVQSQSNIQQQQQATPKSPNLRGKSAVISVNATQNQQPTVNVRTAASESNMNNSKMENNNKLQGTGAIQNTATSSKVIGKPAEGGGGFKSSQTNVSSNSSTKVISRQVDQVRSTIEPAATADQKKPSSANQQHQPYSTSLRNSGFGFGFDLKGGEIDNQLTYIVDVQPNGDAARKGLADGGDKATKASTTTSSSSSALTTSKVRTTTIMSSTVASSSSPATEVEPAETAAEAKATEAEAVENVAATAPPVPASSPPASPSKQQQQTVISSSSSKTATPVHVPVTTTTTTTSSSDRRLAGGNDANKLVASYPISYSSTSTTTTVASTTSPYKSTIAPRPTVISRRAMDRNATSQAVMPYASNAGGSSINSYAIAMRPAAQSAAGIALKETRENERKQLSELNDRFAGYVERVRFLEAQNKKLQIELDMLKSKWGQETKHIEKMYQVELEEARSVLNDTSKTKDTLQVKLDRNEQELNEMKKRYYELENQLARDKEKIAALQDQIAANESEIGLIRRRLTDLQDEEKRYKLEAQRMMNEIQRVSYELECEVKQRLSLENDKQSLEEELVFLKEVHSKEIEELKHLSFKDSGIDPSTFFKSELSTAIKEIREEYENLNQSQRNELEGWYRMKISEIQRKNAQAIGSARMNESEFSREQAKKLRTQITDSKRNITDLKAKNAELESRIRDLEEEIKREENDSSQILTHKEHEIQILKEELNRIIAEYDDLMATKSDLEVEIRTYRKLLEGEENRDGLRQIVETIEHRARAITAGPSAASGYSSVCREESSSPKCCSDEEEEAGSQSCSEPEEDVFYEKLGEGEAEEEEEELNDEDLLEFEFDLTNILAQSGRQQQQQQQPNNISNNNFELDDSQLVETFKNYKSLYNEFNENVSKLLLSSDLETESELLERVNEQLEAINKSFEISQSAKSRRPRVHQEPSAATACQSGGDFSGGGHCSVCTQIKQQNHQTTTTTKLHDANDYYRLMFAEKSSMSSSQADQQQALNQSDQMIAVGHAPRKLSSSVTVTRYNSTSSTPQISTRIRFFQEMALATTNTATTNPSSHIPPNADPDHN